MTTKQPNLLQLAKQGNPRAIAGLMNRSLQPKGISVKVAFKDNCLQVMLESTQVPDQKSLVAFVSQGITSLGTASIEKVKIYGKCLDEEFPAWSQEFELAGKGGQNRVFTFEEGNTKKTQLQTPFARDVLEQFMNLKARTSIGISYNDLPPILGAAKLAVQKFELSSDSKACPYMTELIKKVMLYHELSLECLGQKVKRSSIANAVFIGLGSLTGIGANEPLGRFITTEFPTIPKSAIHGLYEFDTVISALWLRAGELTEELHEILNKPVDLETLKSRKLEVTAQLSTPSSTLGHLSSMQVATDPATSHSASADKKIFTGILAIFLGALGIHKFILGYTKEGTIMLLVTLFTLGYGAFIMALIGIIEGIIYLTKSDREFLQTYVTSKKGWF